MEVSCKNTWASGLASLATPGQRKMLMNKEVGLTWPLPFAQVSLSCFLSFDVRVQGFGDFLTRLFQKFSSASKYAALSVDGEDENEGEDYTE